MVKFKIVDSYGNEFVVGYRTRKSAERNAKRLNRALVGVTTLRVIGYNAPKRVRVRVVREAE
jgi:hypothetical protein